MSDTETTQALTPSTAARLPATQREIRVVTSQSGLYDTSRFEHMQRIAQVMARASFIPDHLKANGDERMEANYQKTLANCFMLVNQADRWNADPFSLSPETYEHAGKLGYSGKLVAAIVNTRAGLKRSLNYTFTGAGQEREVTVRGTFSDEAEERTITLKVKDAITKNAMWTKDPDQKLVYSGATKWARRHCPEIILGIMTDDDFEQMKAETATDVTPARPQRIDYEPNGAQAEERQPLRDIIDSDAQQKAQDVPADPKPTRRRSKPVEATTDAPVQQEVQSAAEVSEGALEQMVDEVVTDLNKQPEPEPEEVAQTAEEGPLPWEIVSCDGELLQYDDPEDFYRGYMEEIERAFKEHGVDGINGFLEANEAEARDWASKIDAVRGKELGLAAAKLVAPAGGSKPVASGTLDLDAPIRK